MSGPDDFDWHDEFNRAVVLRAYGSIAVHENPFGDVVVRQERGALEDEDHWVAIPVQDAEHIAHAIIRFRFFRRSRRAWRGLDSRGLAEPAREPRLALPSPAHPTARPTVVKRDAA
jgi:hypothetical protein